MLLGAKRPLIIAGGGARFATEQVRRLARRLSIPVVTTNAGKGILPEGDPLSLGSALPFEATAEAIADADIVLAVGTELGETDLLYTGRSYKINGQLIRIDIDPSQLTMNYRPAIAVLSDAGVALDMLLEALGERTGSTDRSAEERVAAIKSDIAGDAGWSTESFKHKRVLDVVASTLHSDAIICADSTQLAYTGNHYYPTATPGTWLFPNGYGTLGSSMPAAVGAKIGRPDREVLAIVGDGSFLYSIEELTTAVENNLSLPIIVWNNRAYGEIRDAMITSGIPTVGVDLYTPDFITIARGFGCHAVEITDLKQLADELRSALSLDKPTILQIDSDAPMFSELNRA